MCFLCGVSVDGCIDKRKVLTGDEFDTRLRVVIHERGIDDWALAVQGCLDAISIFLRLKKFQSDYKCTLIFIYYIMCNFNIHFVKCFINA